jgi:hypothetical protein
MSYKIEKYANKEQFIVEYNHRQNLQIQDGAELVDGVYTEFTYALLPNEIMVSEEVEIDVPEYDENGEVIGTRKETVILNYPIENPNYEEEQKQKEKERIAMLKLTRGDVFRGLLQAKGVTRSYIRDMINQLPDETTEEKFIKEMASIDFDEALDFYRGNQLINTIGFQLGITSEQLDAFFMTNDYKVLLNE